MSLLAGLLETLWPPECAACRAEGKEPFCHLCAEALEPAREFQIAGVERARALWQHGGPAAMAVHHLKFHDRPELARPLGRALCAALPELLPIDLVVPVPLSRARLVARGYNQARELIRELGLPAAPLALERRGDLPPQVGLSREARLANLSNAIAPARPVVRDRHVLLVDDVVTTGATAQACASALRAAGARSVRVLALNHAEVEASHS